MNLYTFDEIPKAEKGFCIPAYTMKEAWLKAYILAKKVQYFGILRFRNKKANFA